MILIALISVSLLYSAGLKRLVRDKSITQGEAKDIAFSEVAAISAYIPEVETGVFSFPVLACHLAEDSEDLLEWQDPYRPTSWYDLTRDASALNGEKTAPRAFSRIKHWLPTPAAEKDE